MISLFFAGVIIGIANIVPGVSGGTMAVILNIYDKLIGSVSNLRKQPKESMIFLLPIGVGGVVGIVAFSFIIKYLLTNYTVQLNAFFIGLMLGSLPLVYKRCGGLNNTLVIKGIIFIMAVSIMIFISMFETNKNEIYQPTVFNMLKLFIDSILGAAAMILPGVSGSLVLLILGSYFTILNAISGFNLVLLIPVFVGALIGIMYGSKIINICIQKHEQETFTAICGLMIGSIIVIFSKNIPYNFIQVSTATITLALGFIISYLFSKKA